VEINYNDLHKTYAIDRANKIYRVEFYKEKRFCGMSLVHFE